MLHVASLKGQYWAPRCSPCTPTTCLMQFPPGSVFMYADDTTVYCIGDTVDCAVVSLNKALSELNNWCLENSLTPHSAKCEAKLLMGKPLVGPLNFVFIGDDRFDWVKHIRLLGVTIDERLAWSHHLAGVKKSFLNKLNLLGRPE